MLSVNTYTQEYVDACRARVDKQVAAYRKLAGAATGKAASAATAFEPVFFNNMVLVLETSFTHRARTIEGKDGNPLNEVRVLSNSMLEHAGVLTAEKAIKLSAEKSVLQLQYGDTIELREADFVALAKAFFAEIERKFV
ncbi:MAG: hypothetical protein QOG87_3085 [Actinomycetota bacterium]|jgi:hypothetical protein